MAKKRKADALAGSGSLADKLRRRRQLLEGGNPQEAAKSMQTRKDNQSTDNSQ